jgi:hypothetical protein
LGHREKIRKIPRRRPGTVDSESRS